MQPLCESTLCNSDGLEFSDHLSSLNPGERKSVAVCCIPNVKSPWSIALTVHNIKRQSTPHEATEYVAERPAVCVGVGACF